MFDPTKPSLSPAQLAEKIGGEAWNTDHRLETCLVLAADGSDVICNVSAYDPAVFTLSPRTPVVPPNAPADFSREAPAAPATTETKSSNEKPPAPVAPVPPPAPVAPVPPPAPVYDGAPQIFTMKNGDKFYRSDAMGRRLNADDFDSQEAAAAAPVTLNAYTGEALA